MKSLKLPPGPANLLESQKGQQVVEAILIIAVLMGVTFAVSRYFRDAEVLKQIIQGPSAALAGMLQNGVWQPYAKSALVHPNSHGRHIGIVGEDPR